jgi:hypothetical protein
MSSKTTPTQRSTKWLRDRGFIVAKVEQRLHMPKAPYPVTRDAFYFGDLLVAHPKEGIALVQVTGGQGGNLAARISKIIFKPEDKDAPDVEDLAFKWLQAGGRIFAHGWAKRGARGKAKKFVIDAREIVFNDHEGYRLAEIDYVPK